MSIGIIGGTGLEALTLDAFQLVPVETQWGLPSSVPVCGTLAGTELVFINRHGEEHSIPPHRVNYRANIAALKSLGVDAIIAINAVGGINPAMPPGALVVPDQIIDYTWGRDGTYSDSASEPLQHIDFGLPYQPILRQRLIAASAQAGLFVVDGGVHGVTQGPRLETAAEILRMERDGCDLVGMTGMPEASLARELAIPFACLALVVNPAAGKGEGEITMANISAVMQRCVPQVITLLTAFCKLSQQG